MTILNSVRFVILPLLLLFTFIHTSVVSSCGFPWYQNDPASDAPGYKLFTSRTAGFHISFEYPDTWKRQGMGKYDTLITMKFSLPKTSSVYVTSYVNVGEGGYFKDAGELVQDHFERESSFPEFKVLSRSKTYLDGIEGEELFDSWRFVETDDPHLPAGTVIDKLVVHRFLAVDYKEHIYNIYLSADADEYDINKDGFEHLITTFHFRD